MEYTSIISQHESFRRHPEMNQFYMRILLPRMKFQFFMYFDKIMVNEI